VGFPFTKIPSSPDKGWEVAIVTNSKKSSAVFFKSLGHEEPLAVSLTVTTALTKPDLRKS
jgi:phosphoglycolate phosphatase-like HAD superfamily hydrolase